MFTRLAVRLIVHNYIFDIVVIFFVATTIFKCPILSVRNIIAWHMSFYLDFLFIFVCYYNVSHLWCFVCMRIGLFLCFYVCSFNFLLAKPSKANKRVSVQPRRGSLPLESLPPPLLRRWLTLTWFTAHQRSVCLCVSNVTYYSHSQQYVVSLNYRYF